MNSGNSSTCLSKEQSSTLVLLSILNQATIFKTFSISIKKECMLRKKIGINWYNKFKPLNGQSTLFLTDYSNQFTQLACSILF